MITLFQQAAKAVFGLAFPKICALCYTELFGKEDHICIQCKLLLPKTGFHTYAMNEVTKKIYGRFYFNKASAIYYFHKESKVQQIMHEIKYHGNQDLCRMMGQLMAQELESSAWLMDIDAIIPIPLSERKKHERGFNQSELLAEGIHSIIPIPINDTDVIRKRHTASQTKKNIQERQWNVKDAFGVLNPSQLAHKHLLLLDDVLTTGATMAACAQELLKIPGTQVSVLSLAYAID